ncbi:hypothetical protein HUW62_29375 [Myxococcus sp. AM011]|uniref:hypothetical protein n=1 Tax=Myxococcus sp. AM011 TaxID=2745200 RepID=UPI001595FB3A|nr:hypothetical protein [Myxococcus sp. AM011]NVJ25343.1 hypothetical protein [Myxococcus sp. AM011]
MSEAPDACADVWRAARVDVAFKETPEARSIERTGPRLERRFKVDRQLRGAYRHEDQWASVLEYEAGGTRGGVSYGLTVPEVLTDLTGRTVSWTSHREPASCVSSKGDHPELLSGDTLRDAEGQLLLLTVPSAPTTPDGDVLLPTGLVPELRVRWELAGCERRKGTRTQGARLRFEDARKRGASPVTVSVGETKRLVLGKARYEVRVVSAQADTEDRCGQAVFTVFREGLRERQQ